jgi:hypothetical protein
MAITVTAAGTATSTTSTATLAITTTAAMAVGDVIVVVVASDNNGASGANSVSSVTDGSSNVYRVDAHEIQDPGNAALGATIHFFVATCTTALASGGTITVNYSPNTLNKAAAVWRMTPTSSSFKISRLATAVGGAAATANATVTTASLSSGDVVIGGLAIENNAATTADSDVSNGSWSTAQTATANGGSQALSMHVTTQYKVVTGTGTQTYNLTSAAFDRCIAACTYREVDVSGVAKTETLVDTFTGGTLDTTNWPTNSNATQSGTLILTMPAGGNALVATSGALRHHDSYVLMENTAFPADTGTECGMFVRLNGSGDERYGIIKIGTALFFQDRYSIRSGVVVDNGSGSIVYNATNHRWWCIRETAGKVTYETSPDGTTWTVQRTVGTNLRHGATTQTHIDMFDGTPTVGQTWLPDNYNVPPTTGKGPPFPSSRVRPVLFRR